MTRCSEVTLAVPRGPQEICHRKDGAVVGTARSRALGGCRYRKAAISRGTDSENAVRDSASLFGADFWAKKLPIGIATYEKYFRFAHRSSIESALNDLS